MALITYTDKSQEEEYDPQYWNALDANEVKNVINTNAAVLALKADATALDAKANVTALATKADLVSGVIPLNQLPNATLNTNQFELLSDGSIGIKTSYLISLGLGSTGVTVTPTLSTPSLTATAASTTQINLSWGSITNATSYTLQRATISNYGDATTIFAGNALSYNNTGLAEATTYYYRVKATAAGYNDSNYAGTSAITNSAGAITPSAPTAFVVDDVNNTADWTNNPTYTSVSDYEYTIDGAVTINNVTVKPVNVGDIAKAAGQVGVRIKAASGRNASAWLYNSTAYTSTGGGTYVVEKTFRVNLASQYGDLPANTSAPYYNNFNPAQSLIQSASGFTSSSFVDDTNGSSSIVFKQKGAFAGQVGEVAGEQTTAGNTGVYPNNVVNTAWTINGGTNASVGLSGLDPTKYYQIYVLMPVDTVGTTRGATINGVTKNKTSSSILSTFGTLGNGLNDSEFIVFNNITGSAVDIAFNRVSGNYGATVALIVIEQTNIAK